MKHHPHYNILETNPLFFHQTTLSSYTSSGGGGAGGGQSLSTAMASLHHHHHHNNNNKIRFIGFIKQTDCHPNPNPDSSEFDESDVVWSSSDLSDTRDTHSVSHSPPTLSSSPTTLRRRHHHHLHLNRQYPPFHPDKSGLSTALTDDHQPVVSRKSGFNPSLSAATAARTIPPVPLMRSEGPGGPKCYQSAPVNVPIWPKKFGERSSGNLGNFDEIEDDEEETEMVPPHEIVARSHVTFSVFEGVGRTLKGRDLRRVRNAVFQKTGFLD